MRHYLLILVVLLCCGTSVAKLWQQTKPKPQRVIGYMETAGFEPASRGPDTHLSTCVVY